MIKRDIPSPCLSAGPSDALLPSCSPTSTPHANIQYSARSDQQSQFTYGSVNEFKYIESPLVVRQKNEKIQDQPDISWNMGVGEQQDSALRANFKETSSSDKVANPVSTCSDEVLRPSRHSCRSFSNSDSEPLPSPSPLINSRDHRDRSATSQGSSSSSFASGRSSYHSLFENDNNHQQTPLQRPRSQPKFDETGVFKVPTLPSFGKASVDRPHTNNSLGFFTPDRHSSTGLSQRKTEIEHPKLMNGLLGEFMSPDNRIQAGQKNQNRKGRTGVSSKPHATERTVSMPPSPYRRTTTDSSIHVSIDTNDNTDNEDCTLTAKLESNGGMRKRKRIIESDSESDFATNNKENERSYRRRAVIQTRSQPARNGKGKKECSMKAQKDNISGRERRKSKRLRGTADTRRSTKSPPPKGGVVTSDVVSSASDSHTDSDSDNSKFEMSTDTQIDELTTLMQDSIESVPSYHSITRASNYDDPSSEDDDVEGEEQDSETSDIEASDVDDSNDSSSSSGSASESNSNSDFESDNDNSSRAINKNRRKVRSNKRYISSRSRKRRTAIKKNTKKESDRDEEVMTLSYGSMQIQIGKPLPKTTVPDELWG
ncbi:hypothetical protein BKA69DRAFT_185591 [Paraphysoderma sedebokerense]|nr:hypothetical protein BKA69DRAFT_185591 [Paraphysoderma sedebokerense]